MSENTLSCEVVEYLREYLDMLWSHDLDYGKDEETLRKAWKAQNELREACGILELNGDSLVEALQNLD